MEYSYLGTKRPFTDEAKELLHAAFPQSGLKLLATTTVEGARPLLLEYDRCGRVSALHPLSGFRCVKAPQRRTSRLRSGEGGAPCRAVGREGDESGSWDDRRGG